MDFRRNVLSFILTTCLLNCHAIYGDQSTLQNEIATLKAEMLTLCQQQITYKLELDDLKVKVQAIEEQKPATRSILYGFTAWKNAFEEYTAGDTIRFENPLSNIGNAYNPITSHFTCNISGPYFVNLSLQRYVGYDLAVEAVYEGVRLLAIDDLDGDHDWSYASVSGVFNCNAGNDIWVRAFLDGYINGGDQVSTFTVIAL